MLPNIRERLLDDPVHREVHAGRHLHDPTVNLIRNRKSRCSQIVDESIELIFVAGILDSVADWASNTAAGLVFLATGVPADLG